MPAKTPKKPRARALKKYAELVSRPGHTDPLRYMLDRFEHCKRNGAHEHAQELAMYLIPYGHGKMAQIMPEDGQGMQQIGRLVIVPSDD